MRHRKVEQMAQARIDADDDGNTLPGVEPPITQFLALIDAMLGPQSAALTGFVDTVRSLGDNPLQMSKVVREEN